jgi:NAD(P)-dependent dehydrogenase (short-subunit alcohol dehydrogenase family)
MLVIVTPARYSGEMDVTNKTILITGSTDGVGKLVARQLAEAGARVLLHGRSAEKGEQTLREIREAIGSGSGSGRGGEPQLEYFLGDLASLDEVRRLAETIRKRHDRIDVLINNAGIGRGPRERGGRETSVDGYELRFAVNYLAPFLLTHLLLPAIISAGSTHSTGSTGSTGSNAEPARIVNVSSIGQAPIDFDNVMLEREYDGFRAYQQSKLAQIMFTIDLAAQLTSRQANVTVNALHPSSLMPTKMVIEALGNQFMSTLEDGAHAIIYVATSPDLSRTTGAYFDRTRRVRALDQAYDAAARQKLWDLSMRLVGLSQASRQHA